MLSVSLLKGTRVYQEIKEEVTQEATLNAKAELAIKLLQKGTSIQEIAELLELDEETVRKAIE